MGCMTQRKQPLSHQDFAFIYSKVPRLTVEVIVVVDGGVVLVKRQEASWQGQWHIPGGTVLYKEPLLQVVKRVAQEELGIEVSVAPQIGYIEYPSEEKERGFGWSVGIAFVCSPVDPVDEDVWRQKGIEVFREVPENIIEEQKNIVKQVLSNYT
jgi:ADP-ribose pyrophosphatase YjhB (NUDIX family)